MPRHLKACFINFPSSFPIYKITHCSIDAKFCIAKTSSNVRHLPGSERLKYVGMAARRSAFTINSRNWKIGKLKSNLNGYCRAYLDDETKNRNTMKKRRNIIWFIRKQAAAYVNFFIVIFSRLEQLHGKHAIFFLSSFEKGNKMKSKRWNRVTTA